MWKRKSVVACALELFRIKMAVSKYMLYATYKQMSEWVGVAPMRFGMRMICKVTQWLSGLL